MRTHTCDQHCSGIDLPAGDGQYTGARVATPPPTHTRTCEQHCSGIDLPAGDGQYTGARVQRLQQLHLTVR